MNRVRDACPMLHGPHFSLAGGNREGQDPLRPVLSVPAAIPADEPININVAIDTEADRRAHAWRSLKATIACFAVLSTIFLTLTGLILAFGQN